MNPHGNGVAANGIELLAILGVQIASHGFEGIII